MSKGEEARWMRRIVRSLYPQRVLEIVIVQLSKTSWMAQAAMADGSDRRFRYQEDRLIDEATVGDARIVF